MRKVEKKLSLGLERIQKVEKVLINFLSTLVSSSQTRWWCFCKFAFSFAMAMATFLQLLVSGLALFTNFLLHLIKFFDSRIDFPNDFLVVKKSLLRNQQLSRKPEGKKVKFFPRRSQVNKQLVVWLKILWWLNTSELKLSFHSGIFSLSIKANQLDTNSLKRQRLLDQIMQEQTNEPMWSTSVVFT